MNSFNMASMNMIREEMKAYENDLAGILHHSVGTTENKFMVIANKINQMDTTTLNAVSELVNMIQADASKSAQVIKSTETQFSSVASHFSKVALSLDDVKSQMGDVSKEITKTIKALQISVNELSQQVKGISEIAEGLAVSQTSLKKGMTRYVERLLPLRPSH